MVEIKLPFKVGGEELAYTIEQAMRSSLKMYEIDADPVVESGRTIGRRIIAHKKRDDITDNDWGDVMISPVSFYKPRFWANIMSLGAMPHLDTTVNYSSFQLALFEEHVSKNSERYCSIETAYRGFSKYQQDIDDFLNEFYKLLEKSSKPLQSTQLVFQPYRSRRICQPFPSRTG